MLALLGLVELTLEQTCMQAGDEQQVFHIVHNTGRELMNDIDFLNLHKISFGLLQRLLLECELMSEQGDLVVQPDLGLPQAIDIEVRTYPVKSLKRGAIFDAEVVR